MDRRYDIDRIRVIVFDMLIMYHIGMFFVPWDWEIKNNELIEWVKWPMIFIHSKAIIRSRSGKCTFLIKL